MLSCSFNGAESGSAGVRSNRMTNLNRYSTVSKWILDRDVTNETG